MSLSHIREDVLNPACPYVEERLQRAIDREIYSRYALLRPH